MILAKIVLPTYHLRGEIDIFQLVMVESKYIYEFILRRLKMSIFYKVQLTFYFLYHLELYSYQISGIFIVIIISLCYLYRELNYATV